MAAKTKLYTAPILFAFLALAFPMLVGYLKKTNIPQLTGIVIDNRDPDSLLTKDTWKEAWFSGEYQRLKDDYNNDHWAFKESSVRLNNQFYYSAFNQLRVNGFVSGKENYAFSENYIFAAYGDDLIPEEKIRSLIEKAKVVQDTLKRKGIDLVLVYAPGKGAYCTEFIEDKYKHPVSKTNHSGFVKYSKQAGINYLDLYTWFNNLKATAPYPLFPKFGHHWSYYGECIAVDTIIHYLEKLHGKDMPDIGWSKIDVVDSARSRDADVLKSMNLYRNPDQNMTLAYPEVGWENDTLKNKTRVLTISDSYWYGPVYLGIGNSAFGGGQFWYYNNKVIPSPVPGEKVEVWQLDLKENVESNQVIMLLYSDGNLFNFGNNFIQNLYELYTSPKTYYEKAESNRIIQTYAKQIRETPGFLKKSTRLSDDLGISLDSAIKLDARKMAGLK